MRKLLQLGLFLTLFPAAAACAQSGGVWSAAHYDGLIVGSSSHADIVKALGKPVFRGREEDTGIPISRYHVTSPITGDLTVYESRGMLTGLVLTPARPMTKRQGIRLLGQNFKLVRYAADNCLTTAGSAPIYESASGEITRLEDRNRGMAIALFSNDTVESIIYTSRPFGPKRSRCRAKQHS